MIGEIAEASSLKMREEIYQELWWISTRDCELSVGQLQIDSEGAEYFVVLGDVDRAYSVDEVRLITPLKQPLAKANSAANLPAEPNGRQRREPSCGGRALTFRGWTVFRCGKCVSCRLNGRANS